MAGVFELEGPTLDAVGAEVIELDASAGEAPLLDSEVRPTREKAKSTEARRTILLAINWLFLKAARYHSLFEENVIEDFLNQGKNNCFHEG